MPTVDREKPDVGATVCCKKWVNGELKTYYSRRGCGGGGVLCSEPDPPKPEDGDEEIIGDDGDGRLGIGSGDPQCRQKCRQLYPRSRYGKEETELRRCLQDCAGKKKVDPEIPVVPGTSPCETGGYKLADDPVMAGGGTEWVNDQGVVEYPGWSRDDQAEGHWMWHKDHGYQNMVDIDAFNKSGTPFPTDGSQGACRKGTVRTVDDQGGVWCCPGGIDPDPVPPGPGGEFNWSPGLQGLFGRITERANYLLDYPRGLTPSERQGVINYAVESTKAGERGQIQSSRDSMARSGLLGSGYQFEQEGDIRRDTRNRETQVRREFGIDELDRRFSELMGTTGMVQGLSGTLMQSEQIPEVLSGARRAEGQAAINALLGLYSGSMGNQNSGYNNWIMQQLMGGQGNSSGGIMDWLPWLLASNTGTRTR